MDFPMEIGHIEEIEEHIVESDDVQTVVYPEVKRIQRAAPAQPQKVVLIQTPEGITRAVRVQASGAAASPVVIAGSGAGSSSSSVQLVKTDAGYVQVTKTPTIQRVVAPSSGHVVVKTTSAGKPIVVGGGPKVVTQKTISLGQAGQTGYLKVNSPATSAAARRVTLNPTIKPEPAGTPAKSAAAATPVQQQQRVVKVASAGPTMVAKSRVVASGSPHVVQTPPATVQVKSVTSGQYVEVGQRTKTLVTRVVHKPEEVTVSNQTADRIMQLEGTVVIPGNNQSKYIMLPPDYLEQLETKDQAEIVEEHEEDMVVDSMINVDQELLEVAKKRPCNCNKSQCLKLYCECFANGEFCSDCNCKDCMNTLDNEDERQAAIYNCLERNPNAFRPKIGKVGAAVVSLKHNKGCHCKRSGCLKNYCECFEARIPCSDNCKCVGCKNCDDNLEYPKRHGLSAVKRAAVVADLEGRSRGIEDDEPPPKQPYNFMTAEVVDATVQCMMAQADECQQNGVSTRNTERLILEEFGRCLAEIIDFSNKNTDE